MQKYKLFIILSLFIFIFTSCSEIIEKQGKKGDFSFRKCTSCKITDD